MELFYSNNIQANIVSLGDEEAVHCVRVLRHRCGDSINVIDGDGTLYKCRLISDGVKNTTASIEDSIPGWGSHPYILTLAVCPTKNNDRYEWFAEKACEIGVDRIVPVIGEHSERKVFKTERLRKILLSATKQSLKASIPSVDEPLSVKDFISGAPEQALKLIAYCFEDDAHPRRSIKEVLETSDCHDTIVLIGPEGDFSREEASAAMAAGFIPVHLGESRLRTETAAVTAAEAVYFRFM